MRGPSTDFDSLTFLWQCGPVCDDIQGLKNLIDANIHHDSYSGIRDEVLNYSVFQPRDKGATQRGIEQIEMLLQASTGSGGDV